MKKLALTLVLFSMAGCSVFGETGVKDAPYSVIQSAIDPDTERTMEIRNYDSMVLVSTSMERGRNSAFKRLFNYIAGENEGAREIAMTAPVFMGADSSSLSPQDKGDDAKEGLKIEMTAPVFMGNTNVGDARETSESLEADNTEPMMSFVMPQSFSYQTTPKPSNPFVFVSEVTDYQVAAIQFSWTLSDSNVKKHTQILMDWLAQQEYVPVGKPYTAAYNGPMTLPMYRKNEVLVQVTKQ